MVSPATFPVTAIMNQAPVGTPITLNRTVYQQESIGVIGSELVSSVRNWCHRFGIGVSIDTDHDTDPEPRMPDPHSRLACQNGFVPLVGSGAMIVCPQDGQKLNGYVPGISQWQKAQVMFPQEPFRAFNRFRPTGRG